MTVTFYKQQGRGRDKESTLYTYNWFPGCWEKHVFKVRFVYAFDDKSVDIVLTKADFDGEAWISNCSHYE